jgi:hypothetical protein
VDEVRSEFDQQGVREVPDGIPQLLLRWLPVFDERFAKKAGGWHAMRRTQRAET